MKLSDIKGDRVFDVIADFIGPISRIAEDKEAMELFSRKECPEGMKPKEFFMERAKKSAPVLLKSHKEDMIEIMSIIEGVSAEEYSDSLNMAKLIRDIADMVTDEALLAFLSLQGTEKES